MRRSTEILHPLYPFYHLHSHTGIALHHHPQTQNAQLSSLIFSCSADVQFTDTRHAGGICLTPSPRWPPWQPRLMQTCWMAVDLITARPIHTHTHAQARAQAQAQAQAQAHYLPIFKNRYMTKVIHRIMHSCTYLHGSKFTFRQMKLNPLFYPRK